MSYADSFTPLIGDICRIAMRNGALQRAVLDGRRSRLPCDDHAPGVTCAVVITIPQVLGMAGLLNDAVDQAERLAGENKELRRKQEDAVLDKCAAAISDACQTMS